MKQVLISVLVLTTACLASAEVPDVNDFRIVPQYPDPAAGASLVLGANLSSGRLALWNGDHVYLQEFFFEVGPLFEIIASGYSGDPSFVDIKSDDRTAVLGSGPGGIVYQIDLLNPVDFEAGMEISVPVHFSGVLLNNSLLLLDRLKDDLSGTELVVVDLTAQRSTSQVQIVLSKPFPDPLRVIDLPPASGTASLFVDPSRNLLYAMDGATRELRTFAASAVVAAFDEGSTLDWQSDGTLIGTAGQFLNGGVSGVNRDLELILGGSEGAALTGGIQFVDAAAPAIVLATLDPAATMPAYVVIHNSILDEVIAIDPTTDPPTVYASEAAIPAIPPESPCADFDAIDTSLQTFQDMFFAGLNDIDADMILDTAMFELIEIFCMRGIDESLPFSADTAYDLNLDAFDDEASAVPLQSFREVIALLMTMSQAMQTNVRAAMFANGTPLTGSYSTVTCTDTENCLPEFVEDPDLRNLRALRGPNEPYSAQGDPDGDGLTNLEEYQNVIAMGGEDSDFALAASSELLDGTSGIDTSNSGGCMIATATYGTPLAAEIGVLRGLRDRRLLGNALGTALVDIYYRVSPPLADHVAQEPLAAAAIRGLLHPILLAARSKNETKCALLALFVLGTISLRLPFRQRGRNRNE